MSPHSLDPVHFLLVDDLEENLLALEALLRREGLVLLKARSGPEALELLLRHDVALALVDVQMPDMSGFELAELMRGTERTRNVPIIFLTAGSADQQRRFRGYEAGAVDFLQKPIETDVLKSKAGIFLELYRRRQEVACYASSLEDADRTKDEFLATLAHELRNPLAPVRNALEILSTKPDSAIVDELHHMMRRQISHMSRLIDDLLDMSRIRNGKIELRPAAASLDDILSTAMDISRPLIESAGHRLETSLPPTPVRLHADSTRIAQAVGNLLNNAAKYTPAGGTIRLTAALDGSTLVIKVSDTGIGIAADMLDRVFDLFTQVSGAQSYAQGGLGIGLALAQHIAEMHGGSISAESGGHMQGSTFIIRLPAAQTGRVEEDKPAAALASADVDGKPLKILVADDNVDAAQTITWMLEMFGHEVTQVHNGEDALGAARDMRPHAILLDIGLPDISGYDVCRTLRSDPAFQHTVMVAQTGWGQKRDRDMAFEAGFDHHLVKPATPEDFERVLKDARRNA